MSTTRRQFIRISAAAGAGTALGPGIVAAGAPADVHASGQQSKRPGAPLNILILGGTGFTGPHQVHYAVERGHRVAVFNRGRREADLPASVEHLQGDRNEPDGLAALRGSRRWDVVIDNPTTLPHWVRDAGQILQDRTDHYIFIS
ncbi:MAG: NAD-dependent epimerase/dehydratase family protein, partial [Longimicrobiales bacterium]